MTRHLRKVTFGAILAAALASACTSSTTTPSNTVTTGPAPTLKVLSVTVTPASASLDVGNKITLAVSVNAEAGVTDRTVAWSSSDATIASVDADGLVTANKPGVVTIKATTKADTTISGAAAVTVSAPAGAQPVTITSVYSANLTVTSDPAGHDAFTRYSTIKQITTAITGGAISITGQSPWVSLVGTVDSNNAFTATGSGTVAGFSNVQVSFTGTISGSNAISISGNVVLGPGLPQNQNEGLSLSGSKQ